MLAGQTKIEGKRSGRGPKRARYPDASARPGDFGVKGEVIEAAGDLALAGESRHLCERFGIEAEQRRQANRLADGKLEASIERGLGAYLVHAAKVVDLAAGQIADPGGAKFQDTALQRYVDLQVLGRRTVERDRPRAQIEVGVEPVEHRKTRPGRLLLLGRRRLFGLLLPGVRRLCVAGCRARQISVEIDGIKRQTDAEARPLAWGDDQAAR